MKASSDSKSRALSNGMLGVCIASGPGGKEGQSQTDHYELEQGYAAVSPVLENMFDEAFWKSENMIRIFGVSSNAVEVSVSFMYSNSFSCQLFTGELDPNVTSKHIHQVFRQYGNLAHARIPGGKQCGFVQLAKRCTMSSEHRVKIKVKLHPFVLDSCLAMATRTLIIQVCHLQIRCLLFYVFGGVSNMFGGAALAWSYLPTGKGSSLKTQPLMAKCSACRIMVKLLRQV
ncbi:polyadenylate-binding protein RBP45-like protein [Tanacetum coccineum]|uniref:Polyadenylate-binding protein RBP45-like protein n=1 Tax=Tanacetum coccineum TaxID=301880 RepID=A0ABQ4WAN8_9ASTR